MYKEIECEDGLSLVNLDQCRHVYVKYCNSTNRYALMIDETYFFYKTKLQAYRQYFEIKSFLKCDSCVSVHIDFEDATPEAKYLYGLMVDARIDNDLRLITNSDLKKYVFDDFCKKYEGRLICDNLSELNHYGMIQKIPKGFDYIYQIL